MEKLKIIVGVSGASGSIYALRLLERLSQKSETHLIMSRSAEKTLFLETGKLAADLRAMASYWHPVEDISSKLASGSFVIDGMVIAPCSIHTMSSIAAGISSNLLIRAADVCLKERRKLILMVRETPFHLGHFAVHDLAGGNGGNYRAAHSRFLHQARKCAGSCGSLCKPDLRSAGRS